MSGASIQGAFIWNHLRDFTWESKAESIRELSDKVPEENG